MDDNPTTGVPELYMKKDVPGSAVSKEIDGKQQSGEDKNCGTDVARARWSLLRQVKYLNGYLSNKGYISLYVPCTNSVECTSCTSLFSPRRNS